MLSSTLEHMKMPPLSRHAAPSASGTVTLPAPQNIKGQCGPSPKSRASPAAVTAPGRMPGLSLDVHAGAALRLAVALDGALVDGEVSHVARARLDVSQDLAEQLGVAHQLRWEDLTHVWVGG